MKRKKFKTVAGYLRSEDERLFYQQGTAEREGRTPISTEEGHRLIINHLLRQIGITDLVGQTEKPREAIKRLLPTAQNEMQTKALEACAKWLSTRVEVLGLIMTSVDSGARGVT
jgi:hypothetical protein